MSALPAVSVTSNAYCVQPTITGSPPAAAARNFSSSARQSCRAVETSAPRQPRSTADLSSGMVSSHEQIKIFGGRSAMSSPAVVEAPRFRPRIRATGCPVSAVAATLEAIPATGYCLRGHSTECGSGRGAYHVISITNSHCEPGRRKMPLQQPTRVRRSSKPALDLPPPFRLVTLREVGDAFAHASHLAAEEGAGTLVYVGRFDLVEFALVLEPDEPLASARCSLYAGLAALGDEGFDDLGSGKLVESFARHFMVAVDAWQEQGFSAVAKNYLARLVPGSGMRSDIAENGDLIVRRMAANAGGPERRSLLRALAEPSWLDPATGGPRR